MVSYFVLIKRRSFLVVIAALLK